MVIITLSLDHASSTMCMLVVRWPLVLLRCVRALVSECQIPTYIGCNGKCHKGQNTNHLEKEEEPTCRSAARAALLGRTVATDIKLGRLFRLSQDCLLRD